MKSEWYRKGSLFFLVLALIIFFYGVFKIMQKVDKTQLSTKNGIYTSYISTSQEIKDKAYFLTKACSHTYCKVQEILNFVTNIPYKTETFQRCTPEKTMAQNFGDCDDKSNLLISLLYALEIQAYFVLVPKHIFVIVSLDDIRLSDKKGIWIEDKAYFILESTAKNSAIGYPLRYNLSQIDAIIEPFSNQKIR